MSYRFVARKRVVQKRNIELKGGKFDDEINALLQDQVIFDTQGKKDKFVVAKVASVQGATTGLAPCYNAAGNGGAGGLTYLIGERELRLACEKWSVDVEDLEQVADDLNHSEVREKVFTAIPELGDKRSTEAESVPRSQTGK